MTSRPRLIILLAAWLLATGAQWDAIQVFGWGRMMVNNARTMPMLAAVRQTFDPREMCGVCCAVHTAKREQNDRAVAGSGADKAPIILQAVARVCVVAPAGDFGIAHESVAPESRRDAPPSPPPRSRMV